MHILKDFNFIFSFPLVYIYGSDIDWLIFSYINIMRTDHANFSQFYKFLYVSPYINKHLPIIIYFAVVWKYIKPNIEKKIKMTGQVLYTSVLCELYKLHLSFPEMNFSNLACLSILCLYKDIAPCSIYMMAFLYYCLIFGTLFDNINRRSVENKKLDDLDVLISEFENKKLD